MVRKAVTLLLWIAVFEIIAATIGVRTQDGAQAWYGALEKPPLNPPDFVFPLVWSVLYALIATAGWVLWRRRGAPDNVSLLAVYAGYMALNWSWSFVFFGAQALMPALVWIGLLNAIAIILILRAARTARPVALLMALPTLWTIFAAYLNAGLLILN
jgi:tryptophan-rich sensory protein